MISRDCLTPPGVQRTQFLAGSSFTFTLDEMGTRIDDLERNVAVLMTQAGMKEQAARLPPDP